MVKIKRTELIHPLKTNNDLQNTTYKTKDGATRTTLSGCQLRCPGRVNCSCSTTDICRITLTKSPVTSH